MKLTVMTTMHLFQFILFVLL